jgi:hypothetical protein
MLGLATTRRSPFVIDGVENAVARPQLSPAMA